MDTRAINALTTTILSGFIGSITWIITEMILKRTKKMSLTGVCNGSIAGLSVITPACGFVSPASSLAFGAICKPQQLKIESNVKILFFIS